ncbi:MAG: shikimate dehydrogenase [Candidatus Kaiserbacteria bacterium]|nr:MAG: shikimate dehydrogenase [Candidatus Kaiserbacteria bacterium]
MHFSPATKLTAIFGNPVKHSLSPLLHNAIYEREKIDAVMLAFAHADVAPLVAAQRSLPIHLAAVTMPHKQTIMPLLDEIDATAKAIGAVNTVVNRGGKLIGYNTDVVGISKALGQVRLAEANVLLVGAGGAARCVAFHLKEAGAHIFCTNRDEGQARELVAAFGGTFVATGDLARTSYDVIVNATPIGMAPDHEGLPVDASLIRSGAAVFDLVYAPLETGLLRAAKEKGATTISGLTMFLEQGIEQERLWLQRDIESAAYAPVLEKAVRER